MTCRYGNGTQRVSSAALGRVRRVGALLEALVVRSPSVTGRVLPWIKGFPTSTTQLSPLPVACIAPMAALVLRTSTKACYTTFWAIRSRGRKRLFRGVPPASPVAHSSQKRSSETDALLTTRLRLTCAMYVHMCALRGRRFEPHVCRWFDILAAWSRQNVLPCTTTHPAAGNRSDCTRILRSNCVTQLAQLGSSMRTHRTHCIDFNHGPRSV